MSKIIPLLKKYFDDENERFFKELYIKNEYATVFSRPLDVVIDVGALAGEFGVYIYENAGRIYALEPFEDHYQELEKNITDYELDKILPRKLALAGHNGTAKITTTWARGGNHLNVTEGSVEVETKTLAQFMQDEGINHVDVLKIDIEGNEDVVFKTQDFKDVAPKIDFIIGEHLGGVRNELLAEGFKEKQDKHGNTVFYRE
jgi:FkbM family methyltransferase